jgi:hypothetical protein
MRDKIRQTKETKVELGHKALNRVLTRSATLTKMRGTIAVNVTKCPTYINSLLITS